MLTVLLTYVLTTAIYGLLGLLAFRKIACHLQNNPEAVKAVTNHVLLPLLLRQEDTKTDMARQLTAEAITQDEEP